MTVNEETAHETAEFISKRLSAIKNQRNSGELEDLALIIGVSRRFLFVQGGTHVGCRWQESDVRARKGGVQIFFGVGVVV